MKKYWIPIIAVLAVAVIGVAVWLICFNPADSQDTQASQESQVPKDSQPGQISQIAPFSDDVKQAIEEFRGASIVWYDENGGVEEPGVWR